MCGIFGCFIKKGPMLDLAKLKSMGKMLAHRGPDDFGVFTDHSCAIGNTRLAILDIEGGKQPFTSDDGQIVIVQNGEIFNYIELMAQLKTDGYFCRSHSDTEVILRLYERDGIDFVKHLNGMFSIAIYDKSKQALFLIRDRVGVKPLYLYEDEHKILFASEIKSILSVGIPREVNHQALHHFLSFNYVPGSHTLFKNIRSLPPGCFLKITKQENQIKKWWNLAGIKAEHYSEQDWIAQFNETLNDAVRLRLRSDVPYGAFLSGGIDSSTVVAMMAAHSEKPIQTYAIGFEEAAYDESLYAQMIADRFQTQHTLKKVSPEMLQLWPLAIYYCDQPHGDVSFMPTYCVSELASKNVKVVLTGDGGDELFAGYDRYVNFFSQSNIHQYNQEQFNQAYFDSISLFSKEDKKILYQDLMLKETQDIDSFEILAPLLKEAESMDRINQVLYADTLLLLPGNNLVKPDRMGMAVSLEARTPFLDLRMLELAFRMPGTLKLKAGQTKYLFKKAVADRIGHDITYRKKQMFTVPIGDWFKDKLRPVVDDILFSPLALERGLFKPERVRFMIDQHCLGAHNYTREIRALISVEIWFRQFIDHFYARPVLFKDIGVDLI